MHHAPAVAYPVQRPLGLGAAMLLIWLAGGCALFAWALQSGRPQGASDAFEQGRHAGVLLMWLLCGGAALWQWRAMPQGQISWDGLVWQWISSQPPSTPREGSLEVVLDLQRQVLARWRPQAHALPGDGTRGAWLWLRAGAAPAQWHGLRCAVYSPAAVQNPPSAVGLNA